MITMSLTPEQELEMYSDIKVIKSKLEGYSDCQEDHEKRIKKLENAYWWLLGIGTAISYFINQFLK